MTARASLLFALRLLFPRTGKKSNARRSLVGATVCIGISLVPLVMVLAVSDGMIKGITDRMVGLSSSHVQCVMPSILAEEGGAARLVDEAGKVASLGPVTAAFAEIQGIALAASSSARTGATVRAVEPDVFERNASFRTLVDAVAGEKAFPTDRSAVIGAKLAETLGVGVGDTIRLITIRDAGSGRRSLRPKITPLVVSGIVSCGYQELDALWVFVPLASGASFLPPSSSRFVVGAECADSFGPELERAVRAVEAVVPPGTLVNRWSQLNSAEYENFASTRILLLFIMLLIVLVASVNISSALVMLVMERRKEIAILKSLGASNGGIALSFLVTGLASGGIGVAAGIPAGLMCAVNFRAIMDGIERLVNAAAAFLRALSGGGGDAHISLLDPAFYLQNIPLSVPLPQLVVIAVGTLALSLLVSAVPAVKAGAEKPIETLRKI